MAYFKQAMGLAAILLMISSGIACSSKTKIHGSGASFPEPLYTTWFKAYNAIHPEVQVDYQATGSAAGVRAITDHTVDFGASDAAMTPEEIAQVDVGVQLLPMTAGSIVLAYNVPGVDNLKLSREANVGIFMGKITKWNDPAIASTNDGVKLPDSKINVVVRADGSGTSYVFSKHLSTISKSFSETIGTNKLPNWPVGTKSQGNDGVADALNTTPGSFGYVEYGFAISPGAKFKMAQLENKAGKYIAPSIASGQAALASLEMPEDLKAWLPDPDGEKAYPIVTYTWILAYKNYPDPKKGKTFKDVLTYCLTEGQKQSEALGYIPLPSVVVEKVKAALDNIKSPADGTAKTDDKAEKKSG